LALLQTHPTLDFKYSIAAKKDLTNASSTSTGTLNPGYCSIILKIGFHFSTKLIPCKD
jgi:hypothetical protein